MGIAWEDAVPGKDDAPRLLRLRPADCCNVRLLGPYRGLWLHWLDGGHFPCQGDGCPHCGHTARVWKGYAPCLLYRRNHATGDVMAERRVVELSEDNARRLDGHDLVGLVVQLERSSRPKSPTVLQIPERQPSGVLTPAFPVEPTLYRLWGLAQRQPRTLRLRKEA